METENYLLKYIFPFIVLIQYFGCDSYHEVVPQYYEESVSTEVVTQDCSEVKNYTYNGFYAPSEDGKLLKRKEEYYIDSIRISKAPLITFQDVKYVKKDFDNFSRPCISLEFNKEATLIFKEHTANNVGKKIAIVIKDSLISAPVINSEISGGQVQITSSFTKEEVDKLYNYLNLLKDCK